MHSARGPGRRLGARVLPRRGWHTAPGAERGGRSLHEFGRPLWPFGEAVDVGRERSRRLLQGSADVARQAKSRRLESEPWMERF